MKNLLPSIYNTLRYEASDIKIYSYIEIFIYYLDTTKYERKRKLFYVKQYVHNYDLN